MNDQIQNDIKAAMLAGDKFRVDVLKMIKSALINKRIELGHELSEVETQQVLRSESKKRLEAIDLYRQGGNSTLADKESAEVEIIDAYLPSQMSDDELKLLVAQVKADLGDGAAVGAKIQETLKRAAGRADGKRVSQLIQQAG